MGNMSSDYMNLGRIGMALPGTPTETSHIGKYLEFKAKRGKDDHGRFETTI
jgi:hypothetical protein